MLDVRLIDDPLVAMIHEQEALRRWAAGEEPGFSSGVCDSLTCGYGKLDHNGYWEFPLYPAEEYLELCNQRDRNASK